jgi:hypothetical protein
MDPFGRKRNGYKFVFIFRTISLILSVSQLFNLPEFKN